LNDIKNTYNFNNFNGYFRNKKILITGHTGFKGSWLSIWLLRLGAEVAGYALDPYTPDDNFVLARLSEKMTDIRWDIRDFNKLNSAVNNFKPEIIFHLAAQPLVRESYKIPLETIETNVTGTANVLEAFRLSESAKILIVITSDKCYDNKEQLSGYKETDPMGGYDPYSASKGAAELISSAYLKSFFNPENFNGNSISRGKAMATVRAGNVIGGGDWAKDRLIPDCVRAIEKDNPVEVRNPNSIRPWQHVLEPLSGYLFLASKILDNPKIYSGAWNFGPFQDSTATVREVVEKAIKYYGRGEWKDVSGRNEAWGTDAGGSGESCVEEGAESGKDGSKSGESEMKSHAKSALHEAKLLSLNIDKAVIVLGWKPRLSIDEAVKLTVDYYKRCHDEDVYELCNKQIEMYEEKM
jgi:CDP-glucose 4,6-dehydratase